MPKDSKPRGRMSAYAYYVQHCREEHRKKHPNESVAFAEFSKKCSEGWKSISDKEKNRFQKMAEKDKARYNGEMANYKPKKGEGRKQKRTKDPNAPKRPLSAFFWFCNDERPKARAAMPDATVGTIAKELGSRWAECTVRAKYEALAAKDKARYEKELAAFKAGQGSGSRGKASKAKVASDEEEDDDEEEEEEDDDDDEDDE